MIARPRRRRAALIVVAVAAAGCAGDRPEIERIDAGRGPDRVAVFRAAEAEGPLPGVIFLHGWGATDPRTYRPWIEHLVRRGNAVIYPIYQESALWPPALVLRDSIDGVRAGLRAVEIAPDSLVIAGHSAGGALAADLAASAAAAGLPRPRAVFAAYPGRRLEGVPATIPAASPRSIAPDTRILALAGADDRVVGDSAARAIVRSAPQVPRPLRRLSTVTDPAADDHLAPQRADPAARRVFWRALDRLIDEARGRPAARVSDRRAGASREHRSPTGAGRARSRCPASRRA